jgi:hypothetical protein
MKRQWRWAMLLAVLTIGTEVTTKAVDDPTVAEQPPTAEPRRSTAVRSEAGPVTMRAGMLAGAPDELAGFEVRLLDARVVGVLEPHAFLIEPATRYMKGMGQRDRLLVLINGGSLQASPEILVGSTIRVIGVARTLLGMQTTREAPWPAQLTAKAIERWEVRAAVLASSVQTADGVELTSRATGR